MSGLTPSAAPGDPAVDGPHDPEHDPTAAYALEADAVARAIAGGYALNAEIYNEDGTWARAMATEVRCGTVDDNETIAATVVCIESPMGGMRQSWMGRPRGAEGLLRFTETRPVATQRLRFSPQVGMSDRTNAAAKTTDLRLVKKLGRA